MERTIKIKPKKRESQQLNIFSRGLLTRSILISIIDIGNNLHSLIEKVIKKEMEGKCTVEGFIKHDSCNILTYSSGLVQATNVKFEVVFECQIACPVEGTIIKCRVKNVTKAGICAESLHERPSPIIVFIARDHHFMSEYFSSIKEQDEIEIKVIGQRFELNDKVISVIATLVEAK
jgi:DNA-directed RNA polymerase subunit E'/Rpb7